MRAYTVVLMLTPLLGMAAGAQQTSDPATVYDIPRINKIVIDGREDDWGQNGFRVDLLVPVYWPLKPLDDHDARIRLGWNDEGLLVLVFVQDDKWVEHPAEGWLWLYDGVEVFLAPKPGAEDMCQWTISPGMTATNKSLRRHLHDHRKTNALKNLPAAIAAARVKTKQGCIYEALLPWKALAIRAEVGCEVGFQIMVNDADEPEAQTYHAAWFPSTDTSHDSTNMHRLRLAERPGPSVSLASWSRYDWTAKQRRISVIAPLEYAGNQLTVAKSGKRIAEAQLTRDAAGRAMVQVALPEAPLTGLAEYYSIHLAGAAVSRPRVEGAKDFRDYEDITDEVQRWVLARMYLGHDEIDRTSASTIEAGLHHLEGADDPGDVLDFLRCCGAKKAQALWPFEVELRPSAAGLSVNINRWLSNWTGSTGYPEAPLLDGGRPSSGKIVVDVRERNGPAPDAKDIERWQPSWPDQPLLIKGRGPSFRCKRGKTPVNPRWYEKATVDLTPMLRPVLRAGKIYLIQVTANIVDGRQVGESSITVDHQLKSVVFDEETSVATATPAEPPQPVVELEHEVYSYEFADNGADPMWCHGSSSIVRVGRNVFASGIETMPDEEPLCNVRWMLFKGTDGTLAQISNGGNRREREPCPMACFPADGRVFLSVNPCPMESGELENAQILEYSALDDKEGYRNPRMLVPKWSKPCKASPHSYRNLAADGPNNEFILLYQDYRIADGWKETLWAFYSKGRWAAQGVLKHPSIRVTYPAIQLRNRALYHLGSTDPVPGGSCRDFQQLFYTWSDDITTGEFHDWVEIANRERTGGYVYPMDLYVSPDREDERVHILWFDRALSRNEEFREKFAPGEKQITALNYSIIKEGNVIATKAIEEGHEDGRGHIPSRSARFHATPDGRLYVLYHVRRPVFENRLVEILPDGSIGKPVKVPMKAALHTFFTAGVRAGCKASWYIDVFGDARTVGRVGGCMRYARIRVP